MWRGNTNEPEGYPFYTVLEQKELDAIESRIASVVPYPHGKVAFIAGIDIGLFESGSLLDAPFVLRNCEAMYSLFDSTIFYASTVEFQDALHEMMEKGGLKYVFWITNEVSAVTAEFVQEYCKQISRIA